MKILLLNDNPVVNKLVTLSAQKTSDNLEVVSSIDSVASSVYDLIVIDDTLYTDDLLDEIKTKITFTKSLYICARGAEKVDAFTNILSKPFLPTELVEIFATLGKESQKITLDTVEESTPEAELEEFEELDELDDLEELADIDEDLSDSILDDEEAQKVKDLLNETDEEEELDLDDLDLGEDDLELDEELSLDLEEEPKEAPAQEEEELDLDDLDLGEDDLELDEELSLDLEEEPEEAPAQEEEELDLDDLDLGEDDLELDEELSLDLEEEPEEAPAQEEEELDIEAQIENAVDELSEEELESEVDAETLLNIVENDMNVFDGLTSKDLKIAIGEEVEEEGSIIDELVEESSEEENEVNEEVVTDSIKEETSDNNGIEALKKLLTALSDKDVAASMKGMKISINITLGDQ